MRSPVLPHPIGGSGRPAGGSGGKVDQFGTLTLFLFTAAILMACGGEPPEILSIESRLETRPLESGRYESLSVFVAARDPDGVDDLEALWILSDEAELYWSLSPETWTRRAEGSDTWIGEADLAMPDRGPLPRGLYRVLLADLAGRRYERSFRLEEAGSSPPPPALALSGDSILLDSAWSETSILAYDTVGSLIKAVPAKPGKLALGSLLSQQELATCQAIAAYGFNPTTKNGAYTWRTNLR